MSKYQDLLDQYYKTKRSYKTIIVGFDDKQVVLPMDTDNEQDAIDKYLQTGESLGEFNTLEEAEQAKQINQQKFLSNQDLIYHVSREDPEGFERASIEYNQQQPSALTEEHKPYTEQEAAAKFGPIDQDTLNTEPTEPMIEEHKPYTEQEAADQFGPIDNYADGGIRKRKTVNSPVFYYPTVGIEQQSFLPDYVQNPERTYEEEEEDKEVPVVNEIEQAAIDDTEQQDKEQAKIDIVDAQESSDVDIRTRMQQALANYSAAKKEAETKGKTAPFFQALGEISEAFKVYNQKKIYGKAQEGGQRLDTPDFKAKPVVIQDLINQQAQAKLSREAGLMGQLQEYQKLKDAIGSKAKGSPYDLKEIGGDLYYVHKSDPKVKPIRAITAPKSLKDRYLKGRSGDVFLDPETGKPVYTVPEDEKKKTTVDKTWEDNTGKKRTGVFDTKTGQLIFEYNFPDIENIDDSGTYANERLKSLMVKVSGGEITLDELQGMTTAQLKEYKPYVLSLAKDFRQKESHEFQDKRNRATRHRQITKDNNTITQKTIGLIGVRSPHAVNIRKYLILEDAKRIITQLEKGEFIASDKIGLELASILASSLQGTGVATEGMVNALAPHSLKQTIANVMSYTMSDVRKAMSDEQIQQLKHQIDGQYKIYKQFYNNGILASRVMIEQNINELPHKDRNRHIKAFQDAVNAARGIYHTDADYDFVESLKSPDTFDPNKNTPPQYNYTRDQKSVLSQMRKKPHLKGKSDTELINIMLKVDHLKPLWQGFLESNAFKLPPANIKVNNGKRK